MNWDQHLGKDSTIHKFWNSTSVGCLLWLFSVALLTYWCFRVPTPGKAIGALAVVAGIMSIRDLKVPAKILWVAILAFLLRVEFKAIDKDRTDNQKQALSDQQAQQDEFQKVLDTENENFAKTGGGLKTAYEQSQHNFSATVQELKRILETTKHASELSKQSAELSKAAAQLSQKNLDAVMGKDSYPCVIPRALNGDKSHVYLLISVQGKNPLTGVDLQVLKPRALATTTLFQEPIGTVSPGVPKRIREPLTDTLSHRHHLSESFGMIIWTQNGQYREELEFRGATMRYHVNLYRYVERPDGTDNLIPVPHELIASCSTSQ